jgi:hypothetical protein
VAFSLFEKSYRGMETLASHMTVTALFPAYGTAARPRIKQEWELSGIAQRTAVDESGGRTVISKRATRFGQLD